MDQYFKDEYKDLRLLLERSNTHIEKSFKIGAPEGPPVLNDVYQLTMSLRKTTIETPSELKIKSVLNDVILYFSSVKQTEKIKYLVRDIENYLKNKVSK